MNPWVKKIGLFVNDPSAGVGGAIGRLEPVRVYSESQDDIWKLPMSRVGKQYARRKGLAQLGPAGVKLWDRMTQNLSNEKSSKMRDKTVGKVLHLKSESADDRTPEQQTVYLIQQATKIVGKEELVRRARAYLDYDDALANAISLSPPPEAVALEHVARLTVGNRYPEDDNFYSRPTESLAMELVQKVLENLTDSRIISSAIKAGESLYGERGTQGGGFSFNDPVVKHVSIQQAEDEMSANESYEWYTFDPHTGKPLGTDSAKGKLPYDGVNDLRKHKASDGNVYVADMNWGTPPDYDSHTVIYAVDR
jgi:hypothetical protein